MTELVNGFVQDGEALLRQMGTAIEAREFDELKDLVHAMKGSAATLGAERLYRVCIGITTQSSADLETRGGRVLKVIQEHFQQARSALLDYLKQRQSATR
jgi:two-component system, sensor histidine kinase RpfC